MKKTMIVLAIVAFAINAHGQQTVDNGIKMYNYKKYLTAEQILAPLAATDANANYYLGLCYLDEGNTAKATETFSKFPEDPANISGTARVAFVNKDVAKGTQIAKDLAAKSKKKEWIQEKYAADAITYTTGGDYFQAVTWYKDALTKNDNPATHIALGDAYRKVPNGGGGGEAMNNYEAVTEKDPKNSLALSRIGDLWYASHNWQGVTENYNKAKDADPNNPLPYSALAEAYSNSGKYQLALENIKKYYELSDKTPADKIKLLVGEYRAQSYCEAGTFAKDVMNTLQLSGEDKLQVVGVLGFSEANCGDSVDALTYMRTWFQQKKPADILPGAYIEFGKLYLKLGMLDSAGVYYNKGIAGDTSRNKTDVYRTIADAFKAKKDYCKSAEWYDNLVKSNPETQALDYFWRGYMYMYCPDLRKAVGAFTEFETKYPDEPKAVYWHARASASIDSEATTGAAAPVFNKWLDKVGPNYDKKNEIKVAYEYLLLYAYNAKDKDNMKVYMDKLRATDPQDVLLKQIEDAEKAGQKKPAPAKGKK